MARKNYDVVPPRPPTWADVRRLAEVVMNLLGGPKGAADKLSIESFYTLAYLNALNTDGSKGKTPIIGRAT